MDFSNTVLVIDNYYLRQCYLPSIINPPPLLVTSNLHGYLVHYLCGRSRNITIRYLHIN